MELCRHLAQITPVFSPFQHGNFTCLLIREVINSVHHVLLVVVVIHNAAAKKYVYVYVTGDCYH